MKKGEKFEKKLLVEGNDDRHVIWALCERFTLQENFDVIECEGIGNLLTQVPLRFKQSGINTIGIIVDADTEIRQRWKSIQVLLSAQGFKVPNDLPPEGLILKNDSGIKVGVWIMPNNNLNGMLEDFIAFLVPESDKLLPIVHSTLADIEKKNLNKYKSAVKSKAVIHSWLSWQEDPGTPMGLGITKKYLNADRDACLRFIHWLQELFKQEKPS